MQKNIAILAVLGTVTLTACGSKADANEKDFGAAMTQYFDKKGDLCLNTKRWPVDRKRSTRPPTLTAQSGVGFPRAAARANRSGCSGKWAASPEFHATRRRDRAH